MSVEELTSFFEKLESELEQQIDPQYFETPRKFSYLIEVIEILGKKIEQTNNQEEDPLLSLQNQNPAYNELLKKSEFIGEAIEDIVKFQHGSLNNSVETMGDVLTAYTKSRVEVSNLRDSVAEIKTVLTSKKTGQTDMKKLWLQKTELEESLRMLNAIELLKDAPVRVQHLTNQNRYLAAVNTLNSSVENMFDIDFVEVEALSGVREQLMDLKGKLLERLAEELKDAAMGSSPIFTWHSSLTTSTSYSKSVGSRNEHISRSGMSFDDGNESVYQSEAGSSDHSRGTPSIAPSEFSESRSMSSRPTSSRAPLPYRSTSHHTISTSAIQTPVVWSTDLQEATEAAEAALNDPKTSGSLYIRLLVKAVGGLNCEEDAERMIFEGAAEQFRRSIFRLKLLRKESENENQEQSGTYSVSNQQELYKKSIAKFTQFVREMLETALNMLKMVLYILKLLNQCKRSTSGNVSPGQNPELKDTIKKAVLQLWDSAEKAIVNELSKHFVEQAVEEMSDHVTKHRTDSALEDSDVIAIRSTSPTTLRGVGSNEESSNMENNFTVCSPSTRLAAPIYRDVTLFSEKSLTLLRDQVDPLLQSNAAGKVQQAVQRTLEEELMPLIQSEVNAEMRDLQMDSQLFMAPTINSSSGPKTGDDADVSEAAKRCSAIIQPLFSHWAELPQHRDQVLTILDRVIRGFSATAREEMEVLSWKLISGIPTNRAGVVEAMKSDPIYTAYRYRMYDGWATVEELFQAITGAPPASSSASPYMTAGIYTTAMLKKQSSQEINEQTLATLLAEFSVWGALWDSKGTSISKDGNEKLASDFSKLSTIAAIAHACDWLVKICAKLCRAALKLVTGQNHHSNRRTLAHLSSGTDESVVELWTSIQSSAKSLSKLSDDCISILRGEMEIVSLTFLRQLVTLQLSPTSTASLTPNNISKTSNKETPKSNQFNSKVGSGQTQDGDNTILTTLNHHIMSIQDAVLVASSSSLLSIILVPLCRLIPRFFMKSLISLSYVEFSYPNMLRLMKSVVACQQNLSLLLESSQFDPTINRHLQDLITDEFDRYRKYTNLLQMRPIPELQEYIRSHRDDYTQEEYSYAWNLLRERNDPTRLPTYDDLLKQLSSRTEYNTPSSTQEKKNNRRVSVTSPRT